jgi:4-carboxymuconolactone decarboxylase
MIAEEERREIGKKVFKDMGWDKLDVGRLQGEFWDFTTATLFADCWSRPGLSLRDREMVTIAVLIASDSEYGIKAHLRNAHVLGLTEREIKEVILQAMYYTGWSKGSHMWNVFQEVLNEPDSGYRKGDGDKADAT